MKRSIIIAVLIIQFAFPVIAQQPTNRPSPVPPAAPQDSRQDDVVRINTNLVQVDPVITDRSGKQVTDLRRDEVQIFEDGKQQQITNFSYVSLATAAPTATARPINGNALPIPHVPLKREEVRRTIALVVDDLGLSFESAYYVRQALKKFVEQQVQSGDLVAIIRTGGGIGALQQFTSDRRQLLAAVEKVKWNSNGRAGISTFAPIGGNRLPSGVPEESLTTDRALEELDNFREDLFAVGTLGALNYVIKGLRELPGRKSVLLLSDGIKIFNRSDPGFDSRILERLRRLADLANRAAVVIYTMDARGLQPLSLTAADSTAGLSRDEIEESLADRRRDFFESQNGLNYLSEQTGGMFFRNNNDLNAGIRRVIQDQEGYYLIGYRPDESTFNGKSERRKFHKLSLKITRPGKFTVRMRNGFYGISDESLDSQTPVHRMVSALTSPFGSAGVHIRLTSLFANDPKIGSIVRSMIHIKASDLTFTPETEGWNKAVFDIVAVTFGDNGVVVDQESRTHTIKVRGETYKRILEEGFTYHLTVPIKKTGAYQLRLALRDLPSDRIGSASQFIDVPDLKKNRLTLSGLVMRGVSLDTYRKHGMDVLNQNSQTDESSLTDAMAGPAVRQFQTGQVMLFGFIVYNAKVDKTSNQAQLLTQVRLFRNGELVFSGKELPVDTSGQLDPKRVTSTGALNLGADLVRGEYVFQVVVTDTRANGKHRVATQWMDFEIVK